MVGLLFIGYATLFLFHPVFQTAIALDTDNCPVSACGRINISYPFRLQTDPVGCGDYQYNLFCENSLAVLHLANGGKYFVQAINYDNFIIRVVDAGIDKDNCSTVPRFPLTCNSFDFGDPYTCSGLHYRQKWRSFVPETIGFIKCPHHVNSSSYLDTSACVNSATNSSLSYSYAYVGEMRGYDFRGGCSLEMVSLLSRRDSESTSSSYIHIHKELAFGFDLSWYNINCRNCTSRLCLVDDEDQLFCVSPWGMSIPYKIRIFLEGIDTYLCMFLVARALCATPCVCALLIYKWRRRHLSGYNTIEEFLQTQNNLMPIRYAYSDIKKITGGFKEMLGKGASVLCTKENSAAANLLQ